MKVKQNRVVVKPSNTPVLQLTEAMLSTIYVQAVMSQRYRPYVQHYMMACDQLPAASMWHHDVN